MTYEVLQLWGPGTNHAKAPGGSAKEGPHVSGGSELGSYDDFIHVLRILALGGSMCRVLRGAQFLTNL